MHMIEEEYDDSDFECDVDMSPLIRRPLDEYEKNSTNDGRNKKCTPRLVVCHAFLLLMALGLIFTGLLFLPWLMEYIYGYIIHHVFVLDPSSSFFEQWAKPSIPAYQRLYFFDIQNPDDLIRGQRPKVVEKGPYVYRVMLSRDNVTFNDNDTVTFFMKYRYFFEEDRSVGPESDIVTSVNSPLMTTAHMMTSEGFLFRTALQGVLYGMNERLMVRRTISEMMWGYQDTLLAIASRFEDLPPAFESGRFGYFAGLNTSYAGQFTVFTGKEDGILINSIDRVDGKESLPFWWSDQANRLTQSTDGSLYHPGIKKMESLQMYQPSLCRTISFNFAEECRYKGIPLLKFSLSPSTYMNATAFPMNEGFCSGQPELCGPSGITRQDPCRYGSPVAISNPHFLGGQQTLLDDVDGLLPNASLHESYMEIEPKTGVPFVMKFRVQINLFMQPVAGLRDTGDIPEMYLPLFWLEQSIEADDEIVAKFKMGFVNIMNIMVGVEWLLFGLGIVVLLVLLVKSAKLAIKVDDIEKEIKEINENTISTERQGGKTATIIRPNGSIKV